MSKGLQKGFVKGGLLAAHNIILYGTCVEADLQGQTSILKSFRWVEAPPLESGRICRDQSVLYTGSPGSTQLFAAFGPNSRSSTQPPHYSYIHS